jgi:hypothetical protein
MLELQTEEGTVQISRKQYERIRELGKKSRQERRAKELERKAKEIMVANEEEFANVIFCGSKEVDEMLESILPELEILEE